MAAPSEPPNVSKVIRAAERLLNEISHANGYYCDGIVVDRGRDPTNFEKDKQDLWARLCRAAGVFPGSEEETNDVTGGRRRYVHTYIVMCLRSLTVAEQQAGKKLDELQSEFANDVKTALEGDWKVKAAGTALGFTSMSCIDHHVIAVRGDEGVNWPDLRFAALVQFRYDWPIPPRT
jgi:hypothetical protein